MGRSAFPTDKSILPFGLEITNYRQPVSHRDLSPCGGHSTVHVVRSCAVPRKIELDGRAGGRLCGGHRIASVGMLERNN